MCERPSLKHICKNCQEEHLAPALYKRHLSNGTLVISFYKYDEIKELLFTKHSDLGFYIYEILASCSMKKFAEHFTWETPVVSLGIDEHVRYGYAHTAILSKALKSPSIQPHFSKLKASNTINYSGKSRAFRLLNPRNFRLKDFDGTYVILVDDIITTGTTLHEATELLKRSGKEVLFCLTLCDVSQKNTPTIA